MVTSTCSGQYGEKVYEDYGVRKCYSVIYKSLNGWKDFVDVGIRVLKSWQ